MSSSFFDSIASGALDIIQGTFSEACVVSRASETEDEEPVTTETRAIFTVSAVDVDGVQSQEMTAQFLNSDFAIETDDEIERTADETSWRVSVVLDDGEVRTAILKAL